jgi:hypothetical protein
LWSLLLVTAACAPSEPIRRADPPLCTPACQRNMSCAGLDAQLIAARAPLLECVGQEAQRGHLAGAHRCYRSLRLLESARWWLTTLTGRDDLGTVYQPAEMVRQEFLCRIEKLARATTAEEVERLYLDMIRSFP